MTPSPTLRRAAALGALIATAALPLTVTVPQAKAQSGSTLTNVIPEAAEVEITAKIVSIDENAREVVLESPAGDEFTVAVGPEIRLHLLKAGEIVKAKYYRSVAFMISPPQSKGGKPAPESGMAAALARPAKTPGGVGVRITRISGLVVGIDHAAHSLEIVEPTGGHVYTVDVTDPERIKRLSEINVGDTVTAVINEAIAVTIKPTPNAYFPRQHVRGSVR